jgi:hypothetical protein
MFHLWQIISLIRKIIEKKELKRSQGLHWEEET